MLALERSARPEAPPERVWHAWVDVGAWSQADHIDSARLEGVFAVGARIRTKAKGFPASTLMITEVDEPRRWVDESRSPGMWMTFVHDIEPRGGGAVLTERVVIRGPVGQVVGRAMRRRLDALQEASVEWLAGRSETEAAASRQPADRRGTRASRGGG